MVELRKEAFGPHGDPSRHRSRAELDAALDALPRPPKDSGRVVLVVRRLADGTRETPASARLSPEEGVPGDGWDRRPPRNPEAQLAVMNGVLAGLIANGQSLTVFGDNLFVDLDLSAQNLPTRARIRVADAIVEVTPKPHNGCSKFQERFGEDALAFVQSPPSRWQNRRGIYWRVVEAGTVFVGAPVDVLSRP